MGSTGASKRRQTRGVHRGGSRSMPHGSLLLIAVALLRSEVDGAGWGSHRGLRLTRLSWFACDQAAEDDYAIRILSLNATLTSPKRSEIVLRASAAATVKRRVDAPLKLALILRVALERFGRVAMTLPCFDGAGSCTYDDVCPAAKELNLPRQCPLEPGDVNLPLLELPIPLSVPREFLKGVYGAVVNATQGSDTVTCYRVSFQLE